MERLTKREFLKRMALAGGALASASLLAACGGAPTPTPVPAKPTEAPKPAEAPKPTAAAKPTVAPAAKPAASKEPVTLRMHMRAGGEKSEPAIYVQRPGEWEQETGNKVKLEPIPGGKDYIPKVDALAASNTIGDILWTSDVYSEHTHLVRFNVLEPVDDYLGPANVKKTEWFQPIIDTLTFNGKTYGLPKTGHPGDSYIWINLKAFDAAGIKRPETYGNTFEQIAEWANKLSKGPKDKREVYGYSSSVAILQAITNGIRQRGGDVIDAEGVKSLADGDAWWEWASWNAQLIAVDKVHPLADVVGTGGIAAMFGAEKVAMVHAQRSFERQARIASQGKFDYTSIQYPRGPKALGWGMSIDTHTGTAASKHKQETFSLVYAMADRRFAYLVAKEQGYLTGRVDNLDAIKELADDHFIKLQQKCTEESAAFWRAKNLRAYEVETAITNQMDLIWLGKRQLDKAFMAETKKVLDEVLAKPA